MEITLKLKIPVVGMFNSKMEAESRPQILVKHPGFNWIDHFIEDKGHSIGNAGLVK